MGLIFGIGSALTGRSPGTMCAQVGIGTTVALVTILAAIIGTWVYGRFSDRLPL